MPNEDRIIQFIDIGYCLVPYTLIDGYYRAVYWDGDYNEISGLLDKPFPDLLVKHNPNKKFALSSSGGFDSSILAKLYDRKDANYFHLGKEEVDKAQTMANLLKGQFHLIDFTPDDF